MPGDSAPAEQPLEHRLSPTRATVQIHDGSVTILPKRAPVGNSGPIRGRSLTIFPAPPATEPALAAALPARQYDLYTATLEPGSLPAVAVRDLSEVDATAAGRALGLSELLHWDGRRANILPL